MKKLIVAILLITSLDGFTQTLCENGYAGDYACENVDLLYFMQPAEFGNGGTNEVWGWTDPVYGTEYVLLGKTNGVAIIDISDPLDPLYIGTLPPHGSNSIWRTLRTYNNYMFVGSEASGHGMQVFNLAQLHNVVNPPVTFVESAWYSGFGKCHSLAINEEVGYAYCVGTNTYSGGLHIVNIQNPLAPVIAGDYALSGYTHEAQVVVYNGPDTDYTGKTIAFCFNGGNGLVIVDVTDPSDANLISQTTYTNVNYCHQAWLTDDQHYMLMDDELDEYYGDEPFTRTLIWDMSDLDAPIHTGDFVSSTTAIDHNQYPIGNLDFQSNYTAGLRILDITDIANANLSEVAFFDHFPYNNSPVFDGTWMSYPYFASGVVAVGDIDYGLFLVEPNFLHADEYTYSLCAADNVIIPLDIATGFAGPVHFTVSGLQGGSIAIFSANDLMAPATLSLEISNLLAAAGSYDIEVTASGMHFSYSRTIHLDVAPATQWFVDNDADGHGNAANAMWDCTQPPGYVGLLGDCNDNNNTMYPGAVGTAINVDNDCNGTVEGDEVLCADLTFDGFVTVSDLLVFVSYIGCTSNCIGDFDQNGTVNTNDMLLFLSAFGSQC